MSPVAQVRRALSFGSLNRDIVHGVPWIVREGETIHASSREVHVGGKGLNQAVALARAGVPTAMAGCIGPDGDELVAALRAYGVDTAAVRRLSEPSGYALIQVDPDGRNCIIVHGGANQALTPQYVDDVLASRAAGDLVVVQNETNLVDLIVARAYARGLAVAYNPSPVDGALVKVDLDQVSHLLVNEGEALALTGETDPEMALQMLAHRHPRTDIVMTQGERGVTRALGEQREVVPAVAATVVDTTGAGDTFTGYYLGSLLAGLTTTAALRRATKAAAIAVTRPGAARSIPAAAEVDR